MAGIVSAGRILDRAPVKQLSVYTWKPPAFAATWRRLYSTAADRPMGPAAPRKHRRPTSQVGMPWPRARFGFASTFASAESSALNSALALAFPMRRRESGLPVVFLALGLPVALLETRARFVWSAFACFVFVLVAVALVGCRVLRVVLVTGAEMVRRGSASVFRRGS